MPEHLIRVAPLLHLVGAIRLAQLAAVEDTFGLVIHIGHTIDDSVRVLTKYDLYLFVIQCFNQLRQGHAGTSCQSEVNGIFYPLLMNRFGDRVFLEPDLQCFEGGFAVELTGFNRCAHRLPLPIEHAVDQAAALVGAGIFAAPVGPNVVWFQDRIEFRHGSVFVGRQNGIQYIGDCLLGFGLPVLHFLDIDRLQYIGLFQLLALRFQQLKFLFDFLAGLFGLIAADIVQLDPGAILSDIGGDQMDVRVAGVVVLVDEVGLIAKPDLLHIGIGDFPELFYRYLLGRMKIQRDMDAVYFGILIEGGQLFEPPNFVRKPKHFRVLSVVRRMDEYRLFLLQFILVIVQRVPEAATGLYDCNHWLSI